MSGIARAEEIRNGTLDRTASPISKAFSESHLHRLMSFVLLQP